MSRNHIKNRLNASQVFNGSCAAIKENLGENCLSVNIKHCIRHQQLVNLYQSDYRPNLIFAKVFVLNNIAHVVYYPGVDQHNSSRYGLALHLIMTAADTVLQSEEFKKKYKVTQLKKYMTVCVPSDNSISESHFVAIDEVDGILTVINPKSAPVAYISDPDMIYLKKIIPNLNPQVIHAGIQPFYNKVVCGQSVISIHKYFSVNDSVNHLSMVNPVMIEIDRENIAQHSSKEMNTLSQDDQHHLSIDDFDSDSIEKTNKGAGEIEQDRKEKLIYHEDSSNTLLVKDNELLEKLNLLTERQHKKIILNREKIYAEIKNFVKKMSHKLNNSDGVQQVAKNIQSDCLSWNFLIKKFNKRTVGLRNYFSKSHFVKPGRHALADLLYRSIVNYDKTFNILMQIDHSPPASINKASRKLFTNMTSLDSLLKTQEKLDAIKVFELEITRLITEKNLSDNHLSLADYQPDAKMTAYTMLISYIKTNIGEPMSLYELLEQGKNLSLDKWYRRTIGGEYDKKNYTTITVNEVFRWNRGCIGSFFKIKSSSEIIFDRLYVKSQDNHDCYEKKYSKVNSLVEFQ